MNIVWIRLANEQAYHRLLTVGIVRHVLGCLVSIDATEPAIVTATEPPPILACPCCWRDFAIRRVRTPTRDLRPNVREVGAMAELEVDATRTELAPAIARAATGEW